MDGREDEAIAQAENSSGNYGRYPFEQNKELREAYLNAANERGKTKHKALKSRDPLFSIQSHPHEINLGRERTQHFSVVALPLVVCAASLSVSAAKVADVQEAFWTRRSGALAQVVHAADVASISAF